MEVSIRLSSGLSNSVGRSPLTVEVEQNATVGDFIDHLCQLYPDLSTRLESVVAVISGRHVDRSQKLIDRQEVALITPISGGNL